MHVNKFRLFAPCAVLALALVTACKSDSPVGPSNSVDPIPNPSGPLNLGDVISLNVNGTDACTNPVFHGAKVVAVGTNAIILNDTLNPKNGFTTADFQRFAARFDTLVYPLDVENFGAPTDIDKNGKIAILFTRAVNELTPAKSAQYTGGFAFSRDLFPRVGTSRADACAGSNQGEYFYLLTPDPSGVVNSNVRTTGFVDSVTTSVLAHEFQHIINASRRLYVNNAAAFEDKWLDEGLAHIAEELLFNREAGLTPRLNLDNVRVRATNAARIAYGADMASNTARYRTYLQAPSTSSPYANGDSLPTRGAAWSFLRYAIDRVDATDNFVAGDGQVVTGSGSVTATTGAATAEYTVTVLNNTLQSSGNLSYSLNVAMSAGGVSLAAAPAASAFMAPAASITPVAGAPDAPVPDAQFESRLRTRERVALTPLIGAARAWYAEQQGAPNPTASRSVASFSTSSYADADAALWFKLVNNTTSGFANLQSVVPDLPGFLRDWQVSHAVDDIASVGTQYQQRSWNFHSVFPGLAGVIYPLQVRTLTGTTNDTGAIVAGGASYYRLVLPANASLTVTLGALSGAASPNLQLVMVRTK